MATDTSARHRRRLGLGGGGRGGGFGRAGAAAQRDLADEQGHHDAGRGDDGTPEEQGGDAVGDGLLEGVPGGRRESTQRLRGDRRGGEGSTALRRGGAHG